MSTLHFLIIVILVLLLVVWALIRAWGKQHQIEALVLEFDVSDVPPNSNRTEIVAATTLLCHLSATINEHPDLDKDRAIREALDVVNINLIMVLDEVENTRGIVTPNERIH